MGDNLLARLAAQVGASDYRQLHAWSIADLDRAWATACDAVGVTWIDRPTRVLADATMPGAEWFPGGTLNLTQHVLARAAVAPDEVAVIEHSQTRPVQMLTWAQLADAVHRVAGGLAGRGIGRHSRVGAYTPNTVETLVAFLATAQLGAQWSSCAPEFGPKAVVDRFGQFRPDVLLTVDGYQYGAKRIDRVATSVEIVAQLPGAPAVIPIRYLGTGDDGFGALLAADPITTYAPMRYRDPLYVLYSSGTTGLPKPIVHSHVGIAVEHMVVHQLHHDLGPGERFFWFTTTGWMMWNYLVSALASGASIVLFEGDPAAADLSTLWQVAEQTDTTVFGMSAGFIMNCRKAGLTPPRGRIREIGSTGAPLPIEGDLWLRERLPGVAVNSISGGTDVCSAFVGANPMTPTAPGTLGGSLFAREAAAFDEHGARCPTGERGELVITTPMPSMPLAFLGDDDGSRLFHAYFDRFPGVWCHGDWVTFAADGSCVISGRSDATLNRGGVRLGTADFYAVVDDLAEVRDSLVVHVDEPRDGVERDQLFLFVQLQPDLAVTDELRATIKAALRTALSPRHVPDVIEAVPSVPRTLSGKRLEVPVKQILLGRDYDGVLSKESLANPAAIDWFVTYAAANG
ncbi:MAG TPA: acetoacetate--CoA ligase [Ilumatobacteraceae bacterium]|nr:acetoacetate--CoA ligase [Ilumatobacteraceae bacterium]